jgi:hypothetical protein
MGIRESEDPHMLDSEIGRRSACRKPARELRREAKKRLNALSPERLKVATDFLAYLEERESNEATEELLRIPGLLAAFKKAGKHMPAGKLADWRKVRKDV